MPSQGNILQVCAETSNQQRMKKPAAAEVCPVWCQSITGHKPKAIAALACVSETLLKLYCNDRAPRIDLLVYQTLGAGGQHPLA